MRSRWKIMIWCGLNWFVLFCSVLFCLVLEVDEVDVLRELDGGTGGCKDTGFL